MKRFLIIFFSVLAVYIVAMRCYYDYTDRLHYIQNSYKAYKNGEITKIQHNANCFSVGMQDWLVK